MSIRITRRRSARPWPEASDDDLLRAVADGDRAAFEELHRRAAPWLTLRLRRRCRDDDLVAEVLQDTFLAVWRSAAAYRGNGQSAGWVWTIASRKLVDGFRRRGSAADTVALATTETAADNQLGRERAPSAEDEALADQLDAPLRAAFDSLSPQLREVLQATVLDGLSTREAAAVLGIPEGTVKTRAMRARRTMREALA
ncbi:MAG: RNA polymerase sigma factor [Angustibacter sp.]